MQQSEEENNKANAHAEYIRNKIQEIDNGKRKLMAQLAGIQSDEQYPFPLCFNIRNYYLVSSDSLTMLILDSLCQLRNTKQIF